MFVDVYSTTSTLLEYWRCIITALTALVIAHDFGQTMRTLAETEAKLYNYNCHSVYDP